jgi:hypothetical protein
MPQLDIRGASSEILYRRYVPRFGQANHRSDCPPALPLDLEDSVPGSPLRGTRPGRAQEVPAIPCRRNDPGASAIGSNWQILNPPFQPNAFSTLGLKTFTLQSEFSLKISGQLSPPRIAAMGLFSGTPSLFSPLNYTPRFSKLSKPQSARNAMRRELNLRRTSV